MGGYNRCGYEGRGDFSDGDVKQWKIAEVDSSSA